MRTAKKIWKLTDRAVVLAAAAVTVIACNAGEARAQWTQPSGSSNIHNTNTGNVGVGTANPQSSLHVSTASVSTGARGIIDEQTSNDGNGALLIVRKSRAGTAAQNGDAIGNLYAQAFDGANWVSGSRLRFIIDGPVSTDNVPTAMQFLTGNNNTGVERMRISSSGNVGIGVTNPVQKFEVAGVISAFDRNGGAVDGQLWASRGNGVTNILLHSNGTSYLLGGNVGVGTTNPVVSANTSKFLTLDSGSTAYAELSVGRSQSAANDSLGGLNFHNSLLGTTDKRVAAIWGGTGGATNSGLLTFYTWNAGTAREVMRMTSAGNVGIGTASPAGRLSVVDGLHLSLYTTPGYGPNFSKDGLTVVANPDVGYSSLVIKSQHSLVADRGLLRVSRHDGISPQQEVLYARMDGNVGLGTTAPAYRLDVQGGQINASGGLCIAGDCRTSWSQLGGGGTQWTTAGSSIHYSSGNVGVGTAGPGEKLHVSGGNLLSDSNNAMLMLGPGREVSLQRDPRAGAGYNGWLESNAYLDAAGIWQLRNTGVSGLLAGFRPDAFDVWTSPAGAAPAWTQQFFVTSTTGYFAGSLGIGTTNPTAKLDVNGDINASGNISAKYQDVAEWVPTSQKLSAGTVVVLDPARSNHVLACASSYDTAVAGVVSAQPGILLGEAGEGKVKVATTGRVRVKVDATKGAIKIGDLLVTSDTPGVAMRSEPITVGGRRIHAPGTIIGKALEPLDRGVGEILVLLSMQ